MAFIISAPSSACLLGLVEAAVILVVRSFAALAWETEKVAATLSQEPDGPNLRGKSVLIWVK
jgi:hypothetical protein